MECAACHRQTYTCFSDKPFPCEDIFEVLLRFFTDRKRRPKPGSYTNTLLKKPDQLLKKIGEEAAELVVALKGKDRRRAVTEAADLLVHVLLALFRRGIWIDDVKSELERRRTTRTE
jgi:phosphoribosyl-ATP pyrophosphohydrolase/phosphoribosyl-AMP cyclohydrolase